DLRVEEGFDEFLPALEKLYNVANPQRQPELATREAINFIGRNRDARFFLYVHYMLPHTPYLPHPDYRYRFSADPFAKVVPSSENLLEMDARRLPVHPEAVRQLRARYDETLLHVDGEVKRLVEYIRSLNLDEDTVVTIAADHGEAFMEHGAFLHNTTVYDEMVHIPLILHGAG